MFRYATIEGVDIPTSKALNISPDSPPPSPFLLFGRDPRPRTSERCAMQQIIMTTYRQFTFSSVWHDVFYLYEWILSFVPNKNRRKNLRKNIFTQYSKIYTVLYWIVGRCNIFKSFYFSPVKRRSQSRPKISAPAPDQILNLLRLPLIKTSAPVGSGSTTLRTGTVNSFISVTENREQDCFAKFG